MLSELTIYIPIRCQLKFSLSGPVWFYNGFLLSAIAIAAFHSCLYLFIAVLLHQKYRYTFIRFPLCWTKNFKHWTYKNAVPAILFNIRTSLLEPGQELVKNLHFLSGEWRLGSECCHQPGKALRVGFLHCHCWLAVLIASRPWWRWYVCFGAPLTGMIVAWPLDHDYYMSSSSAFTGSRCRCGALPAPPLRLLSWLNDRVCPRL